MAYPIRVFISATSKDLGPACEKAATLLRAACRKNAEIHIMADMGYYDGAISSKLKNEIRRADVIVHIVGMRYGRAPRNPFRSPAGYPCSYTQMEYWLAKEYKKSVAVILCAEDFPYDSSISPERDVEVKCQLDHRRYIENDDYEKIGVSDMHQLDLAMHMIGHNLLLRITDNWRQRYLILKNIGYGTLAGTAMVAMFSSLLSSSRALPPSQSNTLKEVPISGLALTSQTSVPREDENGLIGNISADQKDSSNTK